MTEHKFTDEELTKILESCITVDGCKNCINSCKGDMCQNIDDVVRQAIALINRQKANLQEVITLNSKLEAELVEQRSELKILKDSNINLQELYQNEKQKVAKAKQKVIDIGKALQYAKAESERIHRHTEMYHEVKAEAIKEFAESLAEVEQPRTCIYDSDYVPTVTMQQVYNLVKEMTEGTKVSPHEICVVCGDQVPEGWQVCYMCETGQEFLNKKKE